MKKFVKGGAADEPIEGRIEDLERKLDRLRALYESFFMGVERMPPNVPRRELNRLITEMQQQPINNSSLRFRFQSLMQRWVLHTTYWNRTLREIESGTYRRDVAKAQRHLAQRGGSITETEAIALGIPAVRVKAFVTRQQKMRAAQASCISSSTELPITPPPVTLPVNTGNPSRDQAMPGGLSDGDVTNVYRRYLEARESSGDARPALTLEKMRQRLQAHIPRILEEKRCRRVTVDVAVEDGKVRLKAWPIED